MSSANKIIDETYSGDYLCEQVQIVLYPSTNAIVSIADIYIQEFFSSIFFIQCEVLFDVLGWNVANIYECASLCDLFWNHIQIDMFLTPWPREVFNSKPSHHLDQ